MGHPLPIPAKFGRRAFPRSSVILFTEWQNDHNLRLVGGGNTTNDLEQSFNFVTSL